MASPRRVRERSNEAESGKWGNASALRRRVRGSRRSSRSFGKTKEAGSSAGLCANRSGHFAGFGRRDEAIDHGQPELDGGACTARSDEPVVHDNAFICEDRRELACNREMRGVASAGEQTGIVEYGGRGTDGGDPSTGRGILLDEGAHAGIGTEEFHSWTTGKEEHVELPAGNCVERGLGLHDQPVAPCHTVFSFQCGEGHLCSGASEQVNGGHGFELFKAIHQEGKYCGHKIGCALCMRSGWDAQTFFE